jgi:probable rRNA maturation factor
VSTRKSIEVDVQYAAGRKGMPSEKEISTWVKAALAGRADGGQIVIRLVDEAEGRDLNERYRGKRGATNVLSFAFDGPNVIEPPLLGDIVICAPVVVREARAQGKALRAHWAHLVVHGVIHLLGYDHERARDAAIMEAIERDVLASLGYPDPYEIAVPAVRTPHRRDAARTKAARR